jgi:predicted nucleic acid binding AN1-type Zn finger protein
MEVGQHCQLSTCSRLSFLPIVCVYCSAVFCESHFLPEQHSCTAPAAINSVLSEDELLRRLANSGSGGRLPCQRSGCKKLSFELKTAATTSTNSASTAFTHAAPRCERCQKFFCASHRSVLSHGCKAKAPPSEGQLKLQAVEDRKKKAAAVLAKHFPNRKT